MAITGGCLCRAVRYTVAADAIATRICWCRDWYLAARKRNCKSCISRRRSHEFRSIAQVGRPELIQTWNVVGRQVRTSKRQYSAGNCGGIRMQRTLKFTSSQIKRCQVAISNLPEGDPEADARHRRH
jgi:hypothetical protein